MEEILLALDCCPRESFVYRAGWYSCPVLFLSSLEGQLGKKKALRFVVEYSIKIGFRNCAGMRETYFAESFSLNLRSFLRMVTPDAQVAESANLGTWKLALKAASN